MGEPIHVEVQGSPAPRKRGGLLRMLMMMPGLGLTGLGVAIILWPDVLRWMVAGLCILAGLGLSLLGRKMGRGAQRFAEFQATFGRQP